MKWLAAGLAGISYTPRFLVEVHCIFARSFNEHPNSLSLRTLICNTFIEGHPNFLQNIFLSCWNDLLPFLSPLFFLYSILGQQLLFNRKHRHVVPIHGHVYRKLKPDVSRTEKEDSRLRLCFRVADDVPEKKGMDLSKQMSSSKCSFTCICGIFLPFYPSTTTVYARSAFYPSLRFTLSLQSAFYTQSAF